MLLPFWPIQSSSSSPTIIMKAYFNLRKEQNLKMPTNWFHNLSTLVINAIGPGIENNWYLRRSKS